MAIAAIGVTEIEEDSPERASVRIGDAPTPTLASRTETGAPLDRAMGILDTSEHSIRERLIWCGAAGGVGGGVGHGNRQVGECLHAEWAEASSNLPARWTDRDCDGPAPIA